MFFFDQYGCSRVAAGNWTALGVLVGSFARPFGGSLADRFGGVQVLGLVFLIVSNLALLIAQLPPLPVVIPLLIALMLTLGMGNGTVFQLVGQRFPHTVGVATGAIGAAGGFGGFLLTSILGTMKQSSGSYASGLIVYAAGASIAAFVLALAQRRWSERRTVAADVVA
jgi:NNP family nitrate/nitrite transporter-like MFS transporter